LSSAQPIRQIGAATLGDRAKRIVAGNGCEIFVEIPISASTLPAS